MYEIEYEMNILLELKVLGLFSFDFYPFCLSK